MSTERIIWCFILPNLQHYIQWNTQTLYLWSIMFDIIIKIIKKIPQFVLFPESYLFYTSFKSIFISKLPHTHNPHHRQISCCFVYFFLYRLFRLVFELSVQFSNSVVSDSLRPHELQHARPPCLSPIPRVHQIHVHWISDAIQPSHPLSSPSPPAPNPSQHQSLFQWINSSHAVAKVLEFQLQHQSFQWTLLTDL